MGPWSPSALPDPGDWYQPSPPPRRHCTEDTLTLETDSGILEIPSLHGKKNVNSLIILIQSPINPVHILTSYFFKSHIKLPDTAESTKLYFSSSLHTKIIHLSVPPFGRPNSNTWQVNRLEEPRTEFCAFIMSSVWNEYKRRNDLVYHHQTLQPLKL